MSSAQTSSSSSSLPTAAPETRHPTQSKATTAATASSTSSSGPHSMPLAGGDADLIEFSLSPVTLLRTGHTQGAGNQVQQSQGHPHQKTTGHTTHPQQGNPTSGSSSSSSVSDDLIQWSISPDHVLRLQSRYRGRNEAIRRNVMGNVQPPSEPEKPAEQVSTASKNQSNQNDSTKGATTSQNMQHQSVRVATLVQPVSTVTQPINTDILSQWSAGCGGGWEGGRRRRREGGGWREREGVSDREECPQSRKTGSRLSMVC